MVEVLDRVTMQVFVSDYCTMIAAPVQCDVDGIPKGSHYASLPPMGRLARLARFSTRGATHVTHDDDNLRAAGTSTSEAFASSEGSMGLTNSWEQRSASPESSDELCRVWEHALLRSGGRSVHGELAVRCDAEGSG